MNLTIKSYNGQSATFYIQCKGLHSGRPMRNPIPNCFAVSTDFENAFELVYALWKSKKFYNYIGGSVIPFIRITDVKKIVERGIMATIGKDTKKLIAVSKIDNQITILKKQISLMVEMQEAMAKSIFKK